MPGASLFIIRSLDDVPDRLRGGVLSIGNFDGVHRGHAALLGRVRDRANQAGLPAVAITFDPHPIALPPATIDLMKSIKRVFDPHGILNPGKIFPSDGQEKG